MLAEAMKFLHDLAQKAQDTKIVHPKEEPENVYYLDGSLVKASPKPRNHDACDLQAIVGFAKKYPNPSVWYSRAGVVCLIEDNERFDKVELSLKFSPQLLRVQSWGQKSAPMKQGELILMLRTMFKDSLRMAANLIPCLRNVRFSTAVNTGSKIATGKVSIGRSIEAEVTGAEALPEDFILEVSVFERGFNFRGTVEIALEMDAGTETFTLHPIPGSDERAIADAEQKLGDVLRESLPNTAIYYGEP